MTLFDLFCLHRPFDEILGPLLYHSRIDNLCYVSRVSKFWQVICSTKSIDQIHYGYLARLISNCDVHNRWHANLSSRMVYAAPL